MDRIYRRLRRFFVVFFVTLNFSSIGCTDVLIDKGAVWKYLDNGADLGDAWRALNFDDSNWQSGAAPLGYGDGDETTVVNFGSQANKHITTYFRHKFQVEDPTLLSELKLSVMRDDGVIVFLNGQEVHRDNLPPGTITYRTEASWSVGGSDESRYHEYTIPAQALRAGDNLVAVEIHQSGPTSSDISFDLELSDDLSIGRNGLTRGPYLQMGSDDSMVVRWRTGVPTQSKVGIGTAAGVIQQSFTDSNTTTEHEIRLTGLRAATRYYYTVGTLSLVLAGGDADTYFETAPTPGSAAKTRVWVIGDAGTGNTNATNVYTAYLNDTADNYTHLWLMLGDNAYSDGTDSEYQRAVFDLYPQLLKQTPVWPTLGNHDGHSADSASETGPYYDIFSLPRAGEVGGLASGTEAYYSFDYSNIHFVVLDSYDSDRATDSSMLTWLEADLQNTSSDWIVAYWHHPPYSKGSHDSDTEGRMVEMRKYALPILEAYGVDVVMSGHSHSYERSKLIHGHYGVSSGYSDGAHATDAGSGRPAESGAYNKLMPSSGQDGAVYIVAGSSGKIGGGSLDHPAMFVSLNELGSLVFEFDGATLQAKFIDDAGQLRDYFTINKTTIAAPGGQIAGRAWLDGNQNGWWDSGDTTLSGISVSLYETQSGLMGGKQTSATGAYAFTDLAPGTYYVQFDTDGYGITAQHQGSNPQLDSDVDPGTAKTNDLLIGGGTALTNIDAGLYLAPRTLKTVEFCDGMNNYSGTQDTYLTKARMNSNWGDSTQIFADAADSEFEMLTALIRWDIQSIPQDAVIVDVKLRFMVTNPSADTYYFWAFQSDWQEQTANWSSADPDVNRGIEVATFQPAETGELLVTLDAQGRAVVQDWLNGTRTNFGFSIGSVEGSNGIGMRSSEYVNIEQRPALIITYED